MSYKPPFTKCIRQLAIDIEGAVPVGIVLIEEEPDQVHYALLILEADETSSNLNRACYYRLDGTEANVPNGVPFADGQYLELSSIDDIQHFSIISENPAKAHRLKIQLFGRNDN